MSNRSRLLAQPSGSRKKVHKQANVEDLYKEFSDLKYKVDPDSDDSAEFIAKCLAICTQFDLSAEEFALKFDAFRFANKIKSAFSLSDLEKLSSNIADDVENDRRKANKLPAGVRLKMEPPAKASLIRTTQNVSQRSSFDHASLSSQLRSSATDDMDDLFADEAPITVKKEIMSPAKRKRDENELDAMLDGETEEKEGSARKKQHSESPQASEESMTGTDSADATASAPASAEKVRSRASLPFRPTFPLLARGADGQRNELLFPKALGKYLTRANAGEKAVALNEYNLARIEPTDSEMTPEDQAEFAKRIVEIEVFQPAEELLSEQTESEAPEAAAPSSASKVNKYASKSRQAALAQAANGGIDTTIFRYMYLNEDDLRDAVDSHLVESQQIMMEKPEFRSMRQLIKSEATAASAASATPTKPAAMKQTELNITVKKEPQEEKKSQDDAAAAPASTPDGDATMTAAPSASPSSPTAATTTAAAQSSPTPASTAATAINVDDEEADANNVPVVSIASSRGQQAVIVAGRVVYDPNETIGENSTEVAQKLTVTHSVFIEGDKTLNDGARIQVRLNGLRTYSLFPGQIICAKGTNALGSSFAAEELFTDASLPHLGVQRSRVEKYNTSLGFRPLGVVFAAGPFTTTEDLSFAPLFDLLREVLRLRPDVLILQGPFIDTDHKELQTHESEVTATYDQIFVGLLRDIMRHVSELRTKVIIVPSVRDAAAIPVFPQPACSLPPSTGAATAEVAREVASGKLVFVPNPCTVRINDITIGLSSMDILSHLSNSNEIHKAPPQAPGAVEPPGRLQRLTSHLLTSHSYYPLFPAPEGVCLDYGHAASLKMNVTPDLLFLPSKLKHFVSDITPHNTIVINPEYLTKGPSGGTYALVSIHPLKDEEMVPADASSGRIYDHCMKGRTRVDVLRI